MESSQEKYLFSPFLGQGKFLLWKKAPHHALSCMAEVKIERCSSDGLCPAFNSAAPGAEKNLAPPDCKDANFFRFPNNILLFKYIFDSLYLKGTGWFGFFN